MAKEIAKDAKAAEIAENRAEEDQISRKNQKSAKDPVYSADEFAANAKKIFGTRQECVVVALKEAKKTECTVAEAKEIVEIFLKREVR